jgi:MoxR-like ATPase
LNQGSGKTIIAKEFCSILGYNCRIFPLYSDLTARDLLQRRTTDVDGSTTWTDSPLVIAARAGDVCVLDGVERLDVQTLLSLKRFFQDGDVDLPDGQRLSLSRNRSNNNIHPSFRVIALSTPPPKTSNFDDSRQRWISSDLGFSYVFLPSASAADLRNIIMKSHDKFGKSISVQSSQILDLLNKSLTFLLSSAGNYNIAYR